MSDGVRVGWQDYVAIVMRRRWFFVVPCGAALVIGVLWASFQPKTYEASTVILVEDERMINPLIRGLAVSTTVGERIRTLREEILSWPSLVRLVKELALDAAVTDPYAFERLVEGIRQRVSVRMSGPDLISIGYQGQDPKQVQAVVQTISTIFIDRNVVSQLAEADTALSFLEGELSVYKQSLEKSEEDLRRFKELYALEMPVATRLNAQVVELEVALANLLIDNTEEHPTVVQVRRRIEETKRKRNAEVRTLIARALASGQSPEVFADLAKALEEETGAAPSRDPRVEAGREAYRAWIRQLDVAAQKPPAGTTIIAGTATAAPEEGKDGGAPPFQLAMGVDQAALLTLGPRQEQEFARLQRDYSVNESMYGNLLKRREQAKVTERLGDSENRTRFRILEPPRLPLRPVKPNLPQTVLVSLFIGAVLGFGCVFAAEFLDQSFQTAEDVRTVLGLPVLASISTILTDADVRARRERWWKTPVRWARTLPPLCLERSRRICEQWLARFRA